MIKGKKEGKRMILELKYERKNNNEIVLKAAGREGKERKEKGKKGKRRTVKGSVDKKGRKGGG